MPIRTLPPSSELPGTYCQSLSPAHHRPRPHAPEEIRVRRCRAENLTYCAMATKASADLMESSGAGMALQRCVQLRQRGEPLYPIPQIQVEYKLAPRGGGALHWVRQLSTHQLRAILSGQRCPRNPQRGDLRSTPPHPLPHLHQIPHILPLAACPILARLELPSGFSPASEKSDNSLVSVPTE